LEKRMELDVKLFVPSDLGLSPALPLHFTSLAESNVPFENLPSIGAFPQRLIFNMKGLDLQNAQNFVSNIQVRDNNGNFLGVRKVLVGATSDYYYWSRIPSERAVAWSYWMGTRSVNPDGFAVLAAVNQSPTLLNRYCNDESLHGRISEAQRILMTLLILQRQVDGLSEFISEQGEETHSHKVEGLATKSEHSRSGQEHPDLPDDYIDAGIFAMIDDFRTDVVRNFIIRSLRQDTKTIRLLQNSQLELMRHEESAKASIDSIFGNAARRFSEHVSETIEDEATRRKLGQRLSSYFAISPIFCQNPLLLEEWCVGAKTTASFIECMEARRDLGLQAVQTKDNKIGAVPSAVHATKKPKSSPEHVIQNLEPTLLQRIVNELVRVREKIDSNRGNDYLAARKRHLEKRWE